MLYFFDELIPWYHTVTFSVSSYFFILKSVLSDTSVSAFAHFKFYWIWISLPPFNLNVHLFWWCGFLVGSILLGLSFWNSFSQLVLFNWRVKPSQCSYHSESMPLQMSFWFSSSFSEQFLFILLLSYFCVMVYCIDDFGLFFFSSEIYTFICYNNVTFTSSTCQHRTPSSIFCMAGRLIINSLSFSFPWKVITSLILKGSLAGNRNLSWC